MKLNLAYSGEIQEFGNITFPNSFNSFSIRKIVLLNFKW